MVTFSAVSVEPPLPDPRAARVAIPAPGPGAGYWAGAPSAIAHDGAIWLAYRLRSPVGLGRGHAVVVARSDDGVVFEEVAVINRREMDADSLERPALVVTPEGRWRLYLSCATPDTLHWTVEVLEATKPSDLQASQRRPVLRGGPDVAFKDPVIHPASGSQPWQMWVCRHDVAEPQEADSMSSWYATSLDGLDWHIHGVALAGRPGRWDSRGARITSVIEHRSRLVAYYDGRASFAENWEERTGVAFGRGPGSFASVSDEPEGTSPWSTGSLRYLSAVALPDGSRRFFYELARHDGSHDLCSEYLPAPSDER